MKKKRRTARIENRPGDLPLRVESGETFAKTRRENTTVDQPMDEKKERIERKKAIEEFRRRVAELEKIDVTLEEILEWRREGLRY